MVTSSILLFSCKTTSENIKNIDKINNKSDFKTENHIIKMQKLVDKDNKIKQFFSFQNTEVSILVKNMENNEIIEAKNAEKPLIPASTTKIITTFIAKEALNNDFKWQIDVLQQNNTLKITGFKPNLNIKDIKILANKISKNTKEFDKIILENYLDSSWQENDYQKFPLSIFSLAKEEFKSKEISEKEFIKILENELYNNKVKKINIKNENKSVKWKKILSLSSDVNEYNKFISEILKPSDNAKADMLFAFLSSKNTLNNLEIGNKKIAKYNTDTFLYRKGLENIKVFDGSGLSRENKINANDLIDLLEYIYKYDNDILIKEPQKKFLNSENKIIDALAHGEKRNKEAGTLINRLNKNFIVRAKTGTLPMNDKKIGVSSLSGYLLTNKNNILAFTIIMNGEANILDMRKAQDEYLSYLAKAY